MEKLFKNIYNSLRIGKKFNLTKEFIIKNKLFEKKKLYIDIFDDGTFKKSYQTRGEDSIYKEMVQIALNVHKLEIKNLNVKVNPMNNKSLYEIFSMPPTPIKGHSFTIDHLYGKLYSFEKYEKKKKMWEKIKMVKEKKKHKRIFLYTEGKYEFISKFNGQIPISKKEPWKTVKTNKFHIAYTAFGTKEFIEQMNNIKKKKKR